MARGWESKSVESQMEAAELRRARPVVLPKTAEQLRREEEIARIELRRERVLEDLRSATNPRYREQLEAALRHLETQLATMMT